MITTWTRGVANVVTSSGDCMSEGSCGANAMTNSEPRRTMPQVCDNYVKVQHTMFAPRIRRKSQTCPNAVEYRTHTQPIPWNRGSVLMFRSMSSFLPRRSPNNHVALGGQNKTHTYVHMCACPRGGRGASMNRRLWQLFRVAHGTTVASGKR